MISRIYMIRHGKTEGNVKGWFYGSTDLPLTDEGILEVQALADRNYYPFLSENALFLTTGLTRTKETLEAIYGKRETMELPMLQEMHFGDYECHSFNELQEDPFFSKWLKDEEGIVKLPGGESRQDFYERVSKGREVLLKLAEEREEIFLACHGGVVAQLLYQMFPQLKDNMWEWLPNPARGYVVEIENSNPVWVLSLEDIE